MGRSVVLIFCALQLILNVSAKGYYSVIAPGTLHSHHEYSVAIAVHDTDGPSVITVGIIGPSLNATQIIKFSHSFEILKHNFILPELANGDYHLTIQGEGSLNFYNKTRLNYARFDGNVWVQTDKGAYKPNDVVQFRVVFLDHVLRPIHFDDIESQASVLIEDSKGIRVKQFRQMQIEKGVFTGKFQLPQYPAFGTWRIVVKLYENLHFGSKVVNFDVIDYVLPRFEVRVSANSRVSVEDGTVLVEVTARYNYDKPVNGKLTVIGELHSRALYDRAPIILKSADVFEGSSKIELHVKEYKNTLKSSAAIFKITAIVEESGTGTQANASTLTTLFQTRFTIMCKSSETCNTFTPKTSQKVSYEIRSVDGTLPKKSKTNVRLIYTEYKNKKKSYKFDGKLNTDTGIVTFDVKGLSDLSNNSYYIADIEFDGEKQRVDRVYPDQKYPTMSYAARGDKEPKNYLTIKLKGEIRANYIATAVVKSSRPLKYFVYTIMGYGNILEAKRVVLANHSKTAKIEFMVTMEMVPAAKIYVHYLENGLFYYTELKFNVNWQNLNMITITVPNRAPAGVSVAIGVKTLPNSYVSLMGIDQSILLYKKNNDITIDDLNTNLAEFTSSTPYQKITPYPGTVSGAVTLTNGHYDYVLKKIKTTLRSGENDVRASNKETDAFFKRPDRKNFAETWIFEDIKDIPTGYTEIVREMPDTITSWVITGFSVNEENGIAVSYPPHYVTAFLPFFITVKLPHTIRRGEGLAVPALISNYFKEDLNVSVILSNKENDFVFISNTGDPTYATNVALNLIVPANSSRAVSFWIRPRKLGNILLKFKAISALAGDAIQKSLKVIPAGITEYKTQEYLVNVKNNEKQSVKFKLSFPDKDDEYVYNSLRAELSVGDILGPLLSYLITDRDVPKQDGENTISLFVTNTQLLRYLKESNNSSSELLAKVTLTLERNYRDILRLRLENGAFSAFGPKKGSTWLTAYITRYLILANKHIKIDPKIIEEGLDNIAANYDGNGKFSEQGDTIYQGVNTDIWVTANVVMMLSEVGDYSYELIQQSLRYLYSNLKKSKDLLDNAISIYAIQKCGNGTFDISKKLDDLLDRAVTDNDLIWWEQAKDVKDAHWMLRSRDLNVALTSYVLQNLLIQENDPDEKNLHIVKYLIGQRYKEGQFANDFDTTISTEALIEFARKACYASTIPRLEFNVKTEGKAGTLKQKLKINFENVMEMQSIQLPDETRQVTIDAKGNGSALVQLSYQYNRKEDVISPSFNVTYRVLKTPKNKIKMKICVRNLDPNSDITKLVTTEVTLPSGFEANTKAFPAILAARSVKYVDAINYNTVIRIYFYNLKRKSNRCVTVRSVKVHDTVQTMPVPIVVYDYYDRSKKTVIFYHDLDLSPWSHDHHDL